MRPNVTHVEDILAAIKQVATYPEGFDRTAFLDDRKTQDAVTRQIEIMGEAARLVPQEVKGAHPEVDWKGLSRLRNHYIHMYRTVNYSKVWQTCRNTMPKIQIAIEAVLKLHEESDEAHQIPHVNNTHED